MGKSLYKNKEKFDAACIEKQNMSRFEVSKNTFIIKLIQLQFLLKTYKEIMFNTSRFMDILIRDYPDVRKDVLEKVINYYGKSKTKKQLIQEKINALPDNSKGRFMKRRLNKMFGYDKLEKKSEKDVAKLDNVVTA